MHVKRLAVVFGAAALLGSTALAAPASAAGSLTLSGAEATALNLGTQVSSGGVLDGDLAAATYAVRVTSEVTSGKPLFMRFRHTPPAGVATGAPTVAWRQANPMSVFPGGPVTGWQQLGETGTAVLARTGWNTFLAFDEPGRYEVVLEDRKGTPGTDDDSSGTLTVNVLDAYAATGSTLTDDWRPAVSALSVVGVGKALPTQVDLTGLTRVDARGTSGGVGVLNEALADLVAIRHDSAAGLDALGWDLRLAGVPGTSKDFTVPQRVTTGGSRDVPASYGGVDVLRHVGTVVATAYLDRNGSGGFSTSEVLPLSASTQVVARVPGVVTLSATPAKCTGKCTVVLSGTAAGATQVSLAGYGAGKTANVDPVSGSFGPVKVSVSRSATFQASTGDGTSDPVKVTVKSTVVSWSAKAGKGKVVVKVKGGPRGGGTCYVKVSSKATVTKQASGSTGSAGTGTCTVTVKVKAGKRTVKVGYDSPRASISGWSSARTVTVS